MPDSTTAYKFAGTGENNAGVGAHAWANPGNITADDSAFATCEPAAGALTNYHVARNFGFTTSDVPVVAIILGVEIEWRYLTDAGAALVVVTNHQLWNSGVIGSAKTTSGAWPTTETALAKGGSGDGWSASLTSAIVRSANFGAAIWAETDPESIPAIGEKLKLESARMRVTIRMASFRQVSFRFYNDDGSESAQTAIAALNTNITWPLDTPFMLRVEGEETNSGDHDTGFTLQVSRNGGAYADISGTSAARYHNSANTTQGADTTQRLAQSAKTFLTDNDGQCDTGGVGTDKGPYNDKAIEWLHCLTASSAVCSNGDTLDFRMRYTAGAFQTYTQIARVTVGTASQSIAPTGVASAAAVGSPTVAPVVSPTGVASAAAVGSPTIVQEIAPAGVASAAAVGSPAVSLRRIVPTGVAPASAVGQPSVSPQAVQPTGVASAAAVGSPTVSIPHAHPEGIASTVAFGAPVVSGGVVSPVGIASTQAFGGASVTVGSITMLPDGIASAMALGSPTVVQVVQPKGFRSFSGLLIGSASYESARMGRPTVHTDIVPQGIASAAAVGSPTVARVASPVGVAAASAVGSPTVSSGSVVVAPQGVASASAVGSPTVGAQSVAVSGIAAASAVGSPTVAHKVLPTGVASVAAVGSPTVAPPGTPTISPVGIAPAAVCGVPTVERVVQAVGIAPASAVGSPTVTVGTATVSPTGVPSAVSVGLPTVTHRQAVAVQGVAQTGAVGQPGVNGRPLLLPTGVPSAALVGQPSVDLRWRIFPAALTNVQLFGQPSVGTQVVRPVGIARTSAVGQPSVARGPVTVAPAGVASATAVGQPRVQPNDFDRSYTVDRIAPVDPSDARTAGTGASTDRTADLRTRVTR